MSLTGLFAWGIEDINSDKKCLVTEVQWQKEKGRESEAFKRINHSAALTDVNLLKEQLFHILTVSIWLNY